MGPGGSYADQVEESSCLLPRPALRQKSPQEKLDDNLMRLALLLAQVRIGAMMALGTEAFTAKTSEAIVQHALNDH